MDRSRRHIKFVIVPYLMRAIIDLITLTCRIRWHNKQVFDALHGNDKAFIVGMWHNCSTTACWAMRGHNVAVMVSDSRDGEYVARLAKLYGNDTIRGSSSRGAKKAIAAGIRRLKQERAIAITPDGPRGPRYQLQNGILWFSAVSKTPIIPLHIESSRQWTLKSWDKHCFPKPFSTIHVCFGEPINIQRAELEADIDAVNQQVQAAFMRNVGKVQGILTS